MPCQRHSTPSAEPRAWVGTTKRATAKKSRNSLGCSAIISGGYRSVRRQLHQQTRKGIAIFMPHLPRPCRASVDGPGRADRIVLWSTALWRNASMQCSTSPNQGNHPYRWRAARTGAARLWQRLGRWTPWNLPIHQGICSVTFATHLALRSSFHFQTKRAPADWHGRTEATGNHRASRS